MSEVRSTGKVKFFDNKKGFGFIKPDDGSKDVFIRLDRLPKGVDALAPDQLVSYALGDGKKGPYAKDLVVM